LFLTQMSAVLWVTGTQEIEEEAHASETGGKGEGEGEGEGGGTGVAGDAAAGKLLFASAGCGACHTLADAGSGGAVGPNLDEAKPPAALVVERVTNGMGAMPSFSDELTETQIADIAAYVVSATGT
jgi:mono/diheme cytochrome c family protein